ncbi:nitroreductase [Enterovirga aerilata]|uniref:nitroreductase n=1 Tax=Enterovirga aerilata TaxID=2730920 RepID=UPI003211DC75
MEELLQRRSSCRAFLPQAVDRDTIEALFRLAQRSPSGCNAQPWNVVVTSGEGTERFRAALSAYAASNPQPDPDLPFPREYQGVYKQRRRDTAWSLYRSVGVEYGDREGSARQMLQNFSFFGAPHVAIITSDEALGAYGLVDCGLFVGMLLLAAESLGVAAVPQGALGEHSKFVRRFLGIGDDRLVVCGVSFGYPDRKHPANNFRTTRADLREVVTFVDA